MRHRSHRQIANKNMQKEIKKENHRIMQRLMTKKSQIDPIEKHLQDDMRRQKILRMRMQLKNSKQFNAGAKNNFSPHCEGQSRQV